MADISAIKLPNGDIFDLVDEKSGYITAETDPLFSASAAAGITTSDITNWNNKISDDHKWNDVSLSKGASTSSSITYIPYLTATSAIIANLSPASATPNAHYIVKWDSSKYLYSTTPSASDNSTKVATTAYVNSAVGGISVPTKTSDLTNDSDFITSSDLPDLSNYIQNHYSDSVNSYILPWTYEGAGYIVYRALYSNNESSSASITYGVDTQRNSYISLGADSLHFIGNIELQSENDYNHSISLTIPTLSNNVTLTLPNTTGTLALTSGIPTKTSDLTNDSGFVTTDNKVLQETVSNDASYPVLLGYQVGTTNTTSKVHKSFSNFSFNPSTGNLKANKFNGLVLNSLATGFSISGGGTSKTLTINESYTLAGACAKAVDNSISTSSSSSNLPTSAAVASFVEGKGYITSYTETDPVFSASAAADITATDISNWNAKVSDDKTWNGVSLNKTTETATSDLYLPCMISTSSTKAKLIPAYDSAEIAGSIARRTSNGYLIAATPSANDNSTRVATTAYVDSAITALPEPMIFKGSLGTGGTITSLPTAAASNEGYTYKVITAGTYASQSAKVGDTFISDGSSWILIPSGDEPSGTVTSVGVSNATNGGLSISGSPVTSSGTITIGHSNILTSAQTTSAVYPIKIDKNGHISEYGSAVSIPTKTSDLTNDSGFVTTDTNTTYTLSNALSSHKFTSTLTAGGSGSGTSTAMMEFVAGTGITLTDDTTNKKIIIASSVVNTDEKLKVTTISATGSQNFFVLSGNSDNSENKKRSTSALSYYLTSDNKSILAMGASNIMGQIQLIYGDSGGHKVTIQPSSMTGGGDKIITLPDATGTVALTSDIPPIPLIPTDLSDLNNDLNVSDFPNDAGYITGYTETDPVFSASASSGISSSDITNWNSKQAALVSGTNIKTINNQSLLGSGDITTQTIYASTVAPTSADGIDGDVWFIYTPSA